LARLKASGRSSPKPRTGCTRQPGVGRLSTFTGAHQRRLGRLGSRRLADGDAEVAHIDFSGSANWSDSRSCHQTQNRSNLTQYRPNGTLVVGSSLMFADPVLERTGFRYPNEGNVPLTELRRGLPTSAKIESSWCQNPTWSTTDKAQPAFNVGIRIRNLMRTRIQACSEMALSRGRSYVKITGILSWKRESS
jgi:hypothetical protein